MASDETTPTTIDDSSAGLAAAPVAERRPVERDLWGEVVVDDYAWLRDATDGAVIDHLEAENAYTEAMLAPVAELREQLFVEIKSRIKETDLSVPVRIDDWTYYGRTTEGLSYPIHCRRSVPAGSVGPLLRLPDDDADDDADSEADDGVANGPELGPEVVLLDENAEAGDSDFFDVGPLDFSPDHSLMYWGWDRSGDERYTGSIRDLATGEELDDHLEEVSHGSAWALDNRTLFYVKPDETNRPFQVWRHVVGTPQHDDVLVFTESDERFFVGVGLEKDHSFIQIGASSKVTDEVWLIPADDPTADARVVAPRRQGVEYSVAHHGDQLVIRTNDRDNTDFVVMTAPEGSTDAGDWRPIDLGGDDEVVTISGADVTADHLVLFERADGLTRIRVRRWDDGSITEIDQPEVVSTVWPGANPEYRTSHLRYGYGSMISPASLYAVDLTTKERTLLKQQEVLGGYDASLYATDRLMATASDGTEVPISIVWRRDRPSGSGPCVLYAYGAYEASMDPMFSAARLSLLDRGFAFAIAHVRGGGELGRRWYLDGKFAAKTNTFDDLIACARQLIDTGWTEPAGLVLRGGSAGGLTVGASINRAPELFAAAVAEVAFVDVVNTMLDESLPLTVTEWEEWGNPASDEAAYATMRSYAPYENVAELPYPSVLTTGGLNDTRVGFWEPAKWAQQLRRHTTSEGPILLWTDLGAGHGGPSGRYDAWREEARILAYILWVVGLIT